MILIYCDGSTKTNPGDGSFGVVLIKNNEIMHTHREEHSDTTNNRMELMALIYALKMAKIYDNDCIIYCDSAYCVNAYHSWIESWKNNGWRRPRNQEVENLDLMKQIDEIKCSNCSDEFFNKEPILEKVKGHHGNIGNELCDALAAGNKAKFEKFKKMLENG